MLISYFERTLSNLPSLLIWYGTQAPMEIEVETNTPCTEEIQ
jgi:hypothetical protein